MKKCDLSVKYGEFLWIRYILLKSSMYIDETEHMFGRSSCEWKTARTVYNFCPAFCDTSFSTSYQLLLNCL